MVNSEWRVAYFGSIQKLRLNDQVLSCNAAINFRCRKARIVKATYYLALATFLNSNVAKATKEIKLVAVP